MNQDLPNNFSELPKKPTFLQRIATLLNSILTRWRLLPFWIKLTSIFVVLALTLSAGFGVLVFLNQPKPQPAEQAPTIEPPAHEEPTQTVPPEEPAPEPTEPEPEPEPAQPPSSSNNNNSSNGGQSGNGGSSNGGNGGNGSNGGNGGNSGGNGGGGGGGGGGSSFPDSNNTGPSGCGFYTQYTGTLNVATDGTVLNCIELVGTLTINANNVTVQNAILKGTSWWGIRLGNTDNTISNFKLLHSRLYTDPGLGPDNGGYDYAISQESTGYMEIAYNDISGYKDGVTTSNSWIHDNYIHNLSQFDGAHTQDIYVYTGPSQVKIEHNTLINDSPQSQATAAVYVAPDDGHQNDRVITNNFLAGGAYTIYGGDSTATNIVVTDNKFSTQIWPDSGYFGWAAYWWPSNTGNVWSGNTWADGPNVGKPVDP